MSDGLRLLASLLEHSSTVTFGMMEREDFVDQNELVMFDYLKRHHRRYARLPSIDTAMEDTGIDLPETPETVDYYLDKVQQRTVYNGVRDQMPNLRDALMDMDVEGIVRASRAINQVCVPRTGQQREMVDMADLASMVRRNYDIAHGRIGVAGIPTGSAYLDAQTNGYQNGDLIVWVARPSVGKSLRPDTKVLKHDGSVAEVRNIRTGDTLMGPDSRPRKVFGVHSGREEMFRVTPVKGEPWECNRSHILSLRMSSDNGTVYRKGQIINLTIDEYLATNKKFKHHAKLWRTGVEYPERPYTIDPYIVGVWLGDGEKTAPVISTPDREIVAYLSKYAARNNYRISQYEKRKGYCGRYALVHDNGAFSPLRYHLLNECVVAGEKRIPSEYLVNSRSVRMHMLAGLLDTDGHMLNSMYEITTKYGGLKDDILYLTRSLGFAAYATVKVGKIASLGFEGNYWRIHISGKCHEIPCKVARKVAPKRKKRREVTNTGFSIESVGEGEFFGVELGDDHLYLLGDFTVTHNTHLLIHGSRAAITAGKSVLVISMEMPLDQMGARYVAHHAGMDPRKIRMGKLSYWGRKRFEDSLYDLGQQRNFHLVAGNFKKTTDDIDILIQELAPDIVYVDGIYLMRPSHAPSKVNRFESAAYVVDELKTMTLRRDRPIIGTTQFGRDAKAGGSEGNLENIGYTDTIGTHASIVVGVRLGRKVYKAIKHVVNGEVRVKETVPTYPYRHMTLLKGREGEEGEWGMRFQFAPLDFSEVSVAVASGNEPIGEADMNHMG